MSNKLQHYSTGRPIGKNTASYQRRVAIRGPFPLLRVLADMPHQFVEFVRGGEGSIVRRMYIRNTDNSFFCYIPDIHERARGTLPRFGEKLKLYRLGSGLHSENKNNIQTVIATDAISADVSAPFLISPDFKIAKFNLVFT